jgi:hypothetical protein
MPNKIKLDNLYCKQACVERSAIIQALCANRSALLKKRLQNQIHTLPRGFKRGRLLACSSFSQSVWSGESEISSKGFFNLEDLPPWDTWVCFVPQPPDPAASEKDTITYFLISWVPSQFVENVQEGINANPYDCISWAANIDMEFT